MQKDLILSSDQCLQKLDQLKKRIKKSLQIQQDANFLNKYRINFEVTQPTNLVGGKLQQHQIEALQWMINLASQESNGILADDMGLGKTIQAISYLAYMKEQHGVLGKHLIVCPKSVSNNWIRQINKWFPSSRAVLLLNTQKQREECLNEIIRPRKFDIVVTTYEGAKNCINLFSRIPWEVMVIDEAHKIKNWNSQNFVALQHIKASFKLLLTGTPLSNNLQQLWCLLYFIMPHIFDDPMLFTQIQESVQYFQGTQQEKLNFKLKVAKYFHQIINPYFKRRTKKDLDLGLPQKFEKTLYVPLSKLQLQMYKNFLRYGSVYGQGYPSNRHFQNARKICLHPYIFDKIWPEDEQFGQKGIQNCGKLKVLDKLLKIVIAQKRKTLIFSQFTMFLDILEEYCQYREFNYCRLDGNTSLQQRQEYMQDFNNTDKYQIFMLSTRAGGLGINLTGADTVIIYDIDWNPQNDIQAMDRAYRIGQTKNVNVYKLITEYTIEQRIAQFQKYKLIWDELVIQKGAFMAKSKRDDPFANFNVQNLVNIGKGDIFRLELDQNEKTFDQLIKLGEEKEKKMSQFIQQKLKKNVQDLNLSKINPFEEDNEQIPEPSDDEILILKRRDYQIDKRQKSKFDRNFILPAFKFYVRTQKIKQLQFQIFMETNRSQGQQCSKLLNHLQDQLKSIYSQQKFYHWKEEEFNLFVKAHQSFLKESYQQIANFIHTKTQSQVEEYSKVFFEKASNNQRLEKHLKSINLNQKIISAKRTIIQFMNEKKSQKTKNDTLDSLFNLCNDALTKNPTESVKRSINFLKNNLKNMFISLPGEIDEQTQLLIQQAKQQQIREQKQKKQKKEEQRRLKEEAKLKRQVEKKERQQKKARQLEEKKQRAQQRLQLMIEKKKIKQQEKLKIKQEKEAKLQQQKKEKEKKNQQILNKMLLMEEQKLEQQSKRILKKIQSQSSSRRNSEVSSKSTEKKVEIDLETRSQEFNQSQTNSCPLQIVVLKPSMSKIGTKKS